ncbi:hypothetical protein Z043_125058 [Scleropages formosus]|uniref:Uncharacterized protein n=1 Tax=Scleropages formosus TaxID=113540 RepID=A0A0P7W449_SCLFO|nr:hypothetical protein Z043_125058 [Scleropages formosus]
MAEGSASNTDIAEQERFQRILSAQGACLGTIEHTLGRLTEGFQTLLSVLQEQELLASEEQPHSPARAAPAQ